MLVRDFLKGLRFGRRAVNGRLKSQCLSTMSRFLSSHVGRNILKLHDRGIFQSVFPEESTARLLQQLESAPQSVYCGFDPTADSLHIGNLLTIIALLHCQRAGHKPIILLGGATALIGDPSGKGKDRESISAAQVEKNVRSITDSLKRILSNHQQCLWKIHTDSIYPVRILNNADWYRDKPVVEFLSEVGEHFRMGTMLNRHSVSSRLQSGAGMSFKEFSYQVFQSYDWYHLLRTHNCCIQIGGGDQLGNIVAGYDFISKVTRQKVFGLTTPLITTTAGNKLGKTAGNAIWLDSKRTSPFQLYQFFLNLPDTEVERYLTLFTFLSHKEIDEVMKKQKTPESRPAQTTVAEQVTLLVHGDDGLDAAKRWTEVLFGNKVEALSKMGQSELCQLFENTPTTELLFEHGLTVMDVCIKAGCFTREVDAERTIQEGGVSFNYQRVTSPDFVLIPGQHILSNNITLIRLGKKTYYIIKWLRS
ncbi:tyrosine--tRNA ligase, mitochondrial-like isoform X2 [Liolophura sinensis]|uniref:tyrosine--tRNA ligase, mitochondrial-like isoform X2 n=1 Tax=Liolophura sinensis TaxID=3198878 RepID=UPI003158A6E3